MNRALEPTDPLLASNTRTTGITRSQGGPVRGETLAIRPESTAKKQIEPEEVDRGIRSAPLEPIRIVVRELTRPDGKKMKVQVPVYPPFRLEEGSERAARAAAPASAPAKVAPGSARSRKQAKSRRS